MGHLGWILQVGITSLRVILRMYSSFHVRHKVETEAHDNGTRAHARFSDLRVK